MRKGGKMEKRSDIPFDHVCGDCEYCHMGHRLARGGVWDENTQRIVTKELGHVAITHYCLKNLDCVKEVHEYDPVCEDHGEIVECEE
jgi:hypothetical protein